jgi:hypothetical protein
VRAELRDAILDAHAMVAAKLDDDTEAFQALLDVDHD